ncbi:complex III assembly factor LYRM7-like isoform X2 [Acanthaster planci]|uniref:Complex III assembly factor LYRM7 n=1 Tax=Acanthaster planci TaxID=133434 RepID=A0A8B7YEH2_ACAPL|nr:complex III assembly factor LYRM7-like isoform X2 [Acanthaster planci]
MMRSKVLSLFKSLHRTRQTVFQGDEPALNAARKRINEEFAKNRQETDPEEIKQMIKVGEDVNMLMRKTIVQAKLNEAGRYQVRITEDTLREENSPLPRRNPPKTPKGDQSTKTR